MRIGLQLTGNPEKYNQLLAVIREKFPASEGIQFIRLADESALQEELPALDILVCYRISQRKFALATERLKWIHFGAAGIEHSLFPELLKSKVLITNSKGIHKGPVSEFIFGAMLYFAKKFADCRQFKDLREWNQWKIAREMVQLTGKTLGIIGYGSIGKELARKARSFDMKIVALRRRSVKLRTVRSDFVLLGPDGLSELLGVSDFIAVTCPLTTSTLGLIGHDELTLIKPSSVIINVSRGAVIDEAALITALAERKIAGAALDVFTEEPLPAESRLFDLPNVLLSPHISGNFPEYQAAVARQFAHNLSRYLCGKKLQNIVGKKRQY